MGGAIMLAIFAAITGTAEISDRAKNYDARIMHIEKSIERAEDGKREMHANPARMAVKQAKLDSKIARKMARLEQVKLRRDGKSNRRFPIVK